EELVLLETLLRRGRAGEHRPPGRILERDLAAHPAPASDRLERLVERELPGPGRELARPAVVAEMLEYLDQRLAGGLGGEVVERLAGEVRNERLPPREHEVSRLGEVREQLRDRVVALPSLPCQPDEPVAGGCVQQELPLARPSCCDPHGDVPARSFDPEWSTRPGCERIPDRGAGGAGRRSSRATDYCRSGAGGQHPVVPSGIPGADLLRPGGGGSCAPLLPGLVLGRPLRRHPSSERRRRFSSP